MSIFYYNPNHREKFLNLILCRTWTKQQHMCQLLSSCLQSLAYFFVTRKKVTGISRNDERIVIAKGHGGKTDYPPHDRMSDMELREGKNEDTSDAETDMSVVSLTPQKLKAWQKLSSGLRHRGWQHLR